jgi:hypothetical protein
MDSASPSTTSRWRRWLARLGVAGLLFFLLKGLLWLAVPSLVLAKACQ